MSSASLLNPLFERAALWRGGERAQMGRAGVATGYTGLDELLPGNGWPLDCLTELLIDQQGIGELQLLLPALKAIEQRQRWVAWVAPPYIPYAPALSAQGLKLSHTLVITAHEAKDILWVTEQALRSGICGAVLSWPTDSNERALRRLQLAAEAGRSWGVLFRSLHSATESSPAALRMRLRKQQDKLAIDILKRRGGGPTTLLLNLNHALASVTSPKFSTGNLSARCNSA